MKKWIKENFVPIIAIAVGAGAAGWVPSLLASASIRTELDRRLDMLEQAAAVETDRDTRDADMGMSIVKLQSRVDHLEIMEKAEEITNLRLRAALAEERRRTAAVLYELWLEATSRPGPRLP